ncbi:MAG: class I SAM-dependent methyltransferase [Pirellulales bacterium]|nr:class I SAM-dependent methyltransferase [Pirellulales bacterium]
MNSAQFQLHANIEQSHWWFTARRRIVGRLVDELLGQGEAGDGSWETGGKAGNRGEAGDGRREAGGKAGNRGEAGDGRRETGGKAGVRGQGLGGRHVDDATCNHLRSSGLQISNCKLSKPLIVDVGCGTGANLAALANRYHCVGIDSSAEAIALAQARFPGVEFVRGFAPDDLGETARRADLVMLNDVLEHVRDDFLLLSRILAELQPGGFVLITVPADLALWSRHDESFGHFRRYTTPRLEQLWADLPVKTRLLTHFNTRLYPVIRTIRQVNRWRGRSAGAAGTDFAVPFGPVNQALEHIFAGESAVLLSALRGRRRGYARGASLLAVLERLPGEIQARGKPVSLERDYYDPERNVYVN